MKKILLTSVLLLASFNVQASEVCEVKVCNKLSRFSLSITDHIRDSMGEQCFNIILPKEEAVQGKVLASDSRWYQGSFNPTKTSKTTIKKVLSCGNTLNND